MGVARRLGSDELRPLTGEEIRKTFLEFFAKRDHLIVPSSSLIPEDPTVLLTIAGMLPFKPVFLGQLERPSPRATSSQKCIRTNDIENVGRTARHHTFFEMLGNFSFGDYFKKEAIEWAWELCVDVFGLSSRNLVISVFREDKEAEAIWRDVIGLSSDRIIRMDEADNFWSSGPTGPCGPCSEIYYDFNPELGLQDIDLEDGNRFIEFYNLVFMQFNRDSEGTLTPLSTCNIDTGMGLERMAQILQGAKNNYETDLIYPLIETAGSLAGVNYVELDEKGKTSLKVIADHSRAVTHLICDGVTASNLGRGYILRRLLRRVVRHGRLIGIDKPFLMQMGDASIRLMKSAYPDLEVRKKVILQEMQIEEARFLETLARGEKMLADILDTKPKEISGIQAFELYDTYGFPMELTQEIAQEHGLNVDSQGFERSMEEQRQRAKAAAVSIDLTLQDAIDQVIVEFEDTNFKGYDSLEKTCCVQALVINGKPSDIGEAGDNVQIVLDSTTFYGEGGGQVGDRGVISNANGLLIAIEDVTRSRNIFVHSGRIKKGNLKVGDQVCCQVDRSLRRSAQANHTATHLLQSALKKVVDPAISQAGSLVDFARLRFDFYAPRPIKSKELGQIEELINSWINEAYNLSINYLPLEEAQKLGAIAMFGEKYSDVVRVVDVPGVSMELCGGTHVANTAEIGLFKIVSESGVAAGIRRIEAVAGSSVVPYLNERDLIVRELSDRFKVKTFEIVDRVIALQDELKGVAKELATSKQQLALLKAEAMVKQAWIVGSSRLLVQRIDGIDGASLQSAAQDLADKLGANSAVVLGGLPEPLNETKVILVVAFGEAVVSSGLKAGSFIGEIAQLCGGGGGGRPNLAQAGGRDGKALDKALKVANDKLMSQLS